MRAVPWWALKDDGGWHPTITKYGCTCHPFKRCYWLVYEDDENGDPVMVCPDCGCDLYGLDADQAECDRIEAGL